MQVHRCVLKSNTAPCKVPNVTYLRQGERRGRAFFGWGSHYPDREGKGEKVCTKVCMFINFIPMISGLHNTHLTNNTQQPAKHPEALEATRKWPNRLFTWQLTNGSPVFACLSPCPRALPSPESLSDNASAFSSRAKQLHRRMWWRDMKVRSWSHPCEGVCSLYAAHARSSFHR